MNFKKLSLTALSLTLALGLLAGCGGKPTAVVGGGSEPTPTPEATPDVVAPADGTALKTGLSMVTSVSKSKDAAADAEGQAQANIALVAVAVDDEGVIQSCVIDAIQSKINFTNAGAITTDLTAPVLSKNELGDDYGMRKASSISKEWNEQVAALSEYAVGKTVADLKGIAVNENGAPTDADLSASMTLALADFVDGIEAAVNAAEHRGAMAGDKLALTTSTHTSKSKDATADKEGLAQAYATVGVVTLNGETITSLYIDSVQANVNFNAQGIITTDTAATQPSKNELGDDYGMRGSSSIGKEWNEQAAAFCAYATGKTVGDITGLAVTEKGAPADADLAASVTVGIGSFQTLVEKAL